VGAAAARARARACLGFWCGGESVSGWWASEEVAPPMGEEDSKRCRCRSESPRPIPRRVPSSSDQSGTRLMIVRVSTGLGCLCDSVRGWASLLVGPIFEPLC
jgi:hypothetical protein